MSKTYGYAQAFGYFDALYVTMQQESGIPTDSPLNFYLQGIKYDLQEDKSYKLTQDEFYSRIKKFYVDLAGIYTAYRHNPVYEFGLVVQKHYQPFQTNASYQAFQQTILPDDLITNSNYKTYVWPPNHLIYKSSDLQLLMYFDQVKKGTHIADAFKEYLGTLALYSEVIHTIFSIGCKQYGYNTVIDAYRDFRKIIPQGNALPNFLFLDAMMYDVWDAPTKSIDINVDINTIMQKKCMEVYTNEFQPALEAFRHQTGADKADKLKQFFVKYKTGNLSSCLRKLTQPDLNNLVNVVEEQYNEQYTKISNMFAVWNKFESLKNNFTGVNIFDKFSSVLANAFGGGKEVDQLIGEVKNYYINYLNTFAAAYPGILTWETFPQFLNAWNIVTVTASNKTVDNLYKAWMNVQKSAPTDLANAIHNAVTSFTAALAGDDAESILMPSFVVFSLLSLASIRNGAVETIELMPSNALVSLLAGFGYSMYKCTTAKSSNTQIGCAVGVFNNTLSVINQKAGTNFKYYLLPPKYNFKQSTGTDALGTIPTVYPSLIVGGILSAGVGLTMGINALGKYAPLIAVGSVGGVVGYNLTQKCKNNTRDECLQMMWNDFKQIKI